MTALQFAYQSCSCLVLATSRSKGDDFAAIFPKLPIKIPDLISTNSVAITKIFNRLYSNHVCSKPFLRKIGKSNNDNCLKWVQKTIDYPIFKWQEQIQFKESFNSLRVSLKKKKPIPDWGVHQFPKRIKNRGFGICDSHVLFRISLTLLVVRKLENRNHKPFPIPKYSS